MASHHSEPPDPVVAAAAAADGDAPADSNSELPSPPYYIVTKPGQLPVEFLEPSAGQKLVIGFDCEGVDLCRNGALCIMQLAFPDAVYLVDAIEGGKNSLKLALYFQFGIKLHNVMDTQIAYSLIEEQEGKKKSFDEYISFVGLLADPRYCGIPYPEKEEVRILLRQDPNFWKIRPLSDMMIRAATDDVRFLLNIHEKMMEKLSKVSLWRLSVRNDIEPDVYVPEVDILSVLDVPPGKMGRVIGRKGSSIMAVKESCNVEIHIGGAKGPPDRVFIIGPVKEVRKAEAILRGRMLEF
ncbi:hypothetical protein EJB05_15985 [Eragrostis curvula]|uniref:K Homology domain-containing protein n=1 Tax=Eragrostis curvula TaxID=38414 RepID=A0A5J9VDU5_9POAL|nr:hypothetical protein EJB05_15985 [Eragrostis curvula]